MAYTYCTYRKDFDNTLTRYNASTGQTLTTNEALLNIYYTISLVGNAYNYRFDGQQIISNTTENISNYVNYLNINDGVNMTTGNSLMNTYETKTNFAFYSGTTAFALYPLKTNYNTFTGTTAPATYALKSRFNTYTGTTAPATYQTKTSINTLTGTTLGLTYQTKTSIVGLTGTTLPSTYALKTNFNVFTGTTVPNTYLTKTSFNVYSGTTEPTLYASKTKFNTYTGTTAPAIYQTKTSINILTGTTLGLTYQTKSSIVSLTGTTLPSSYASKTNFNLFTGTTSPTTYQTKTSINTLTGTTLGLTYQTKTSIVTLTGTTLPATYALKTNLNTFTGTTAPATYLKITNFNTYSGTSAQVRLTFKDNGVSINTGTTQFTNLNFSSGITLTNKGSGTLELKAIYGSEIFTTGKTATQTTTSATFADYCAHGFILAGGTYKIEYCLKIGNNTANTSVGSQLLIDGTALESGTVNAYRISAANTFVFINGFKAIALTAGSHSIRAQIATSSGTATADYGQIIVTRIS